MSRIKQTIFLLTITILFSSYQDFTEAFINVSKESNPAIVSIISQKEIEFNNPFQHNPFFHDDFFFLLKLIFDLLSILGRNIDVSAIVSS